MSYTLVTVGGTGKDFATFLGWLNQLGFIKPPSHVVIVDGDPTGAGAVLDLLGFAQEENSTFIEDSRTLQPFIQTPEVRINLLNQFNLNATNINNSPMMNLAFSENEQNMDVARGFYSNPKVASSVFVHKETQMSDIVSAILKGGEFVSQPIVIVGSISGGTGAGLIYNIAKMCKEKRPTNQDVENLKPVIGVIYTKYLTIGTNGTPNDIDLAYNSANGLNFLWKNWRTAFDNIFVSGVENRYCVSNQSAEIGRVIAPYPAFLVAAQIFSDGLKNVISKHIQHILTLPQHLRDNNYDGFHIYATRDDERNHYLDAKLIQFSIYDPNATPSRGQYLKVSEMSAYIKEIDAVLTEVLEYPIDQILNSFSMFPIRKLPPKLVQSFKAITPNQTISIAQVKHFYENHLKPNCQKVLRACSDFIRWLNLASQRGLLLENIQNVGNLQHKHWLDTFAAFGALNQEKGAQKALKPVYTEMVEHINYTEPQVQPNRWILPYYQGAINGAGWVRIHNTNIQPINTEIVMEEERETGSCYPSPLGRMEYFKQKLKVVSQNHPVYQDAVTLWYGIALGELYIETINLENYTNLEKTISHATNQKKIGIIRNKEHQVVAASDPLCGFWSGLRSQTDLISLKNILANQEHLNKARSVLKYWFSQITQRLQNENHFNHEQMIEQLPWYRFLTSLNLQTAVDLSEQDIAYSLGTHSPIALEINSQTHQKDFFYPIFYQPFRKQIRNHLLATVINSNLAGVHNPHVREFHLQRNTLQKGYVDVLFNKVKVASIKLPLGTVGHNDQDIEHNTQEGVFHLKIEQNYPIWTINQAFFNHNPIENLNAFIQKLEMFLGYHIAYLTNHFNANPQHNKPELFW